MARLTIGRIFESSKALATEAGKQLTDFINDFADFREQVIRALRNGLTFKDNFNCIVSTVSLKHNTPQVINTNGQQPIGVIVLRSAKQIYNVTIAWELNDKSELSVLPTISGSPTSAIDVVLLIIFE